MNYILKLKYSLPNKVDETFELEILFCGFCYIKDVRFLGKFNF
jgi:hypothetical protein